ncbi:MAG: replication protein [Patescibacteria group bacterium]
MTEKKAQFNGFYLPNSTQVPDALFDDLMADLSGAELKVVLYIIRRTFGFKKQSDSISINQMLKGITKKNGEVLDRGTNLAKGTLLRALKSLVQKNIILTARRFDAKGGNLSTEYRLNILNFQNNKEKGDSEEEGNPPKNSSSPLGSKKRLGLVQKEDPPLVQKRDPQVTVLQDTVNNTVNVSQNGEKKIQKLPDISEQTEKTEYIAQDILNQLKDNHSLNFYRLVAKKIPETTIRQILSEIKSDGAKNPAKLFTYKITQYVKEKLLKIKTEQLDQQKQNLLNNFQI